MPHFPATASRIHFYLSPFPGEPTKKYTDDTVYRDMSCLSRDAMRCLVLFDVEVNNL